MGQNGAVLGQMPHFGPFPLKKISKRGAKKGGKSALTKYTFQNSGWFGIIKEVLLSCFGMKRGPVNLDGLYYRERKQTNRKPKRKRN